VGKIANVGKIAEPVGKIALAFAFSLDETSCYSDCPVDLCLRAMGKVILLGYPLLCGQFNTSLPFLPTHVTLYAAQLRGMLNFGSSLLTVWGGPCTQILHTSM
jgi:hypothetical protein